MLYICVYIMRLVSNTLCPYTKINHHIYKITDAVIPHYHKMCLGNNNLKRIINILIKVSKYCSQTVSPEMSNNVTWDHSCVPILSEILI